VNDPFYQALAFVGSGCLYIFLIIFSFRASSKIHYSGYLLLFPLFGAALVETALIFTAPAALSRDIPAYIAIGHAGKSYYVYGFFNPPAPVSPVLYGPPWAAIASAITATGSQHLATATALFRGLALLAHLINTLLIWAILGKIAPANRLPGTLLYAWNPLVLVELAINGNASGVVLCCLLLAVWLFIQRKGRWSDTGALVLLGLAGSMNLLVLLLAPLFLWFIVRDARDTTKALLRFAWRALVMLAIIVAAYIPVWQGGTTFLAITASLNLSSFVYSPLALIVIPVRALYSLVAQGAHLPPSLMQPSSAAGATVLASLFFLFALLYFREMGRVGDESYPTGVNLTDREMGPIGASHPPPRARACPRPGREERVIPAIETLFTSWSIVIIGYITLVSTVFWPWYVVWVVGVVALRRFDTLSMCAVLLSCSALLYYPLQLVDPTQASVLSPLCIFGIPLVYVIVKRCIPVRRVERNKVTV